MKAERPAEPDLAIHVGGGEAVVGRQELRDFGEMGEAERVELGGEVATDAIAADEHHRADRIVGGAADGFGIGAGRGGHLASGRADLLDRRLGRIKSEIYRVKRRYRPIGPGPAGSFFAVDRHRVHRAVLSA